MVSLEVSEGGHVWPWASHQTEGRICPTSYPGRRMWTQGVARPLLLRGHSPTGVKDGTLLLKEKRVPHDS